MFSYQLNPQEVTNEINALDSTVNQVGIIRAIAWGAPLPEGWLMCDGSAISRTLYSALFAKIGTYFGVGDGTTTFNLPTIWLGDRIDGSVYGNGRMLGLQTWYNNAQNWVGLTYAANPCMIGMSGFGWIGVGEINGALSGNIGSWAQARSLGLAQDGSATGIISTVFSQNFYNRTPAIIKY